MRLLLFLLLAAALGAETLELRARLERLLGGLPSIRTPLNARITGGFERPGYRVDKVVFESLPGFFVTANLYLPTAGVPPYPAILGAAGHADSAKAWEPYQHVWISLARRGYVVLAYDPPGQGERIEYPSSGPAKSRIGVGVPEHIQAGLQCLLTGAPIARYFVWDGMRAVDYLLSRPEVDPNRLGVAGHSGGGTQAAYLAALDPRLKAAVSVCYITRWKELLEGPGPQDAEQVIPGFLREGLDFADFIRAHAPAPFLIASTARDFFPIAGARATYDLVKNLPAVEMAEDDDVHSWTRPLREAAYRFFDRWLQGRSAARGEEAVVPESVESLHTGGRPPRSETIFTLNRRRALEIYPKRRALSVSNDEEFRALIRARLNVPPVHRIARTAPPGRRPGILAAGWPEERLSAFRAEGAVILQLKPLPETETGRGYDAAYKPAALEWLHGRTPLGNLVGEMEGALAELAAAPEVDPRRITVAGAGNSAVAAYLVAALHPEAAHLLTERMPPSWFSFTQTPDYRNLASIAVPGVLLDFDLPDLERLVTARKRLADR